ncbi:MAG: selenocysteine-specific translation elongation factor [Anaerovoracaceae bacterium]|jgi:selenocysteine-specific elongation factor
MHNIIIGTAGHVDHGKTCLIKALTNIETDRLKEEKKRGITIELGFADMPNSQGQHIGIIDVPGHERFVKNMLAGIGGIDLVLLVVAADEGVMPQTVEHFEILKMLKIKKGIIVLTKADLVEPEWLEMVEEDVRSTVKGTFLEKAPMIAVSSYTGQNIEELRKLILDKVKDVGVRKEDPSLLRIPIDRVFTIDGFGTVVTGTLMEGSVKVGSEVQIYPGDQVAKVRSLQVHGENVETAYAGQRTAVNLVNIKKEEINRGNVLAAKGSMKQTMMIDVKIQMFDDTPRILKNDDRLHLYYGSAEVLCKAVLLDKDVLESGQEGYAQLRLEEEIAVKKGDRFIIRFYSPVESIGGGVVLDANPTKHKRFRNEVIEALVIKEAGDENAILEQTIRETSKTLMNMKDIALKLGKTLPELQIEIETLISEGKVIKLTDDLAVHVDYIKFVQKTAESILDEYHKKNPISIGMQKGEFRKKLSDKLYIKELKVLDFFINRLIKNRHLRDSGSLVAASTFKVEYKEEHFAMQKRLEKVYLDAGYEVPELEEAISKEKDVSLAKQMVEALAEEGKLKRLTYQYYMHKIHWEKAMKLFQDHMDKKDSITLAEYRDLLDTSRKYAVMILEYLDEQKITRLVDDVRILL